ncbi:hypothetical protein [Floricoccus penangensis]
MSNLSSIFIGIILILVGFVTSKLNFKNRDEK